MGLLSRVTHAITADSTQQNSRSQHWSRNNGYADTTDIGCLTRGASL